MIPTIKLCTFPQHSTHLLPITRQKKNDMSLSQLMEFHVENFQKRFICEIWNRFLNLMQSEKKFKTNWKVSSTFPARWYKYALDILLIYGSYCFYDHMKFDLQTGIFALKYYDGITLSYAWWKFHEIVA